MEMDMTSKGMAICAQLSSLIQQNSIKIQPETSLQDLSSTFQDIIQYYTNSQSKTIDTLSNVDDLMLILLQKLLSGYIRTSNTNIQEQAFNALCCVLSARKESFLFSRNRLLALLQCCMIYLPLPKSSVEANNNTTRSVKQSDELREVILRCVSLLLCISQAEMNEISLTESEMHMFAYIISSILDIAEMDRCRPVVLQCLEVIKDVLRYIDDPLTIREYFPGICGGLWKCINASHHQGSAIVSGAINCLSMAIKMCIADKLSICNEEGSSTHKELYTLDSLRALKKTNIAPGTSIAYNDEKKDSLSSESSIHQNWMNQAQEKLDIVLGNILSTKHTKTQSHTWKVRLAIVNICRAVVIDCRHNLHESFFRCYEELMVLQVDDITQVSNAAEEVLTILNKEIGTDEWIHFLPKITDRFQFHLSALSLRCATQHEVHLRHDMRILIGYLKFLGPKLVSYLEISINKIFELLARLVKFDTLDIGLLHHETLHSVDLHNNESSVEPNEKNNKLVCSYFQRRFQYFHESESVDVLCDLLRYLGATVSPSCFVDCAFELMHQSVRGIQDHDLRQSTAMNVDIHPSFAASTNDILVILTEMMKAHAKVSEKKYETLNDPDIHLIGRILDEILAGGDWISSSLLHNHQPIEEALFVECVGICVEVIPTEFNKFILVSLYPMLETLGSNSIQVSHASFTTLQKIAFFCGYSSIDQLFQENIDYVIDSLRLRLRNLEQFPTTAFVVEGLLRHTTRLFPLPLLQEITNSLMEAVDLYQGDDVLVSTLLKAIRLLVACIGKELKHEESQKKGNENENIDVGTTKNKSEVPSPLDDFISEMKALNNTSSLREDSSDEEKERIQELTEEEAEKENEKQAIKAAMPVEYEEESETVGVQNGSTDASDTDSTEPKCTPHQKLVVDILDQCSYFLSETNPVACSVVLNILEQGFMVLQSTREILWQLIHRLWPAILARLKAKNSVILRNVYQLIRLIATFAGDFVGTRFVETVWPRMKSILEDINRNMRSTKLSINDLNVMAISDDRMDSSDISLALSQSVVSPLGTTSNSLSNTADLEESKKELYQPSVTRRKTQEQLLLLSLISCFDAVIVHCRGITHIVPEACSLLCLFLMSDKEVMNCSKQNSYIGKFPPQESNDPAQQISNAIETLILKLAKLNEDEVFYALALRSRWMPPSPPTQAFAKYNEQAITMEWKRSSENGIFIKSQYDSTKLHASSLLNEILKSE